MEQAVTNNKVALLNGQTVNIVNDISESEYADDVIEVKSVKYRELVRQSKHVSDDDEDSGRIRYCSRNTFVCNSEENDNYTILASLAYPS